MSSSRRRSLLEDENFSVLEHNAPSGGDVCELCSCTRSKHHEDGCACGKCSGFDDGE